MESIKAAPTNTKGAPEEKPKLEIHVCYCMQKDDNNSLRHWMLMLNQPGGVKGDWIHSTGGPNGKQIPAPFFKLFCFVLDYERHVSGVQNKCR